MTRECPLQVHSTVFTYTHSHHCEIARPHTIGLQFGNYINDSANPIPTNQSPPPNNSFSTCHPHNRPTTMTTMTLGGRSGAKAQQKANHIRRKIIASPQQSNKLCSTQHPPYFSSSDQGNIIIIVVIVIGCGNKGISVHPHPATQTQNLFTNDQYKQTTL